MGSSCLSTKFNLLDGFWENAVYRRRTDDGCLCHCLLARRSHNNNLKEIRALGTEIIVTQADGRTERRTDDGLIIIFAKHLAVICVTISEKNSYTTLFNVGLCNNKNIKISTQCYLPTVLSMKDMGRCMNDWYVARMHNDIYYDISIQCHKGS